MKLKRIGLSAVSVSLVFALLITGTSAVMAASILSPAKSNALPGNPVTNLHEKIDISTITGEGGNPPEITGAASAVANQKQWYEYIIYSKEPVGDYTLGSNFRLRFYDPYDYSNSLVMEINEGISGWSTANNISVSYTTGNSIALDMGNSTLTSTEVSVSSEESVSTYYNQSESLSASAGWSHTKETKKIKAALWEKGRTDVNEISAEIGFETSLGVTGLGEAKVLGNAASMMQVINSSNVSYTEGEEETIGDDNFVELRQEFNEETGESSTVTISNTVARTVGTTSSVNRSFATNDSTTVTIDYNAMHFTNKGVPFNWRIIGYKVFLPIYYDYQYLNDGEWITLCSNYILLTTIQGTCRQWMENNVAYYEHWGTGEEVTDNEFWRGFFTKDALLSAYQNKLYPES